MLSSNAKTSEYAFAQAAGSPVRNARGRGRFRRFARAMKVAAPDGRVRRRMAARSC